MAGLWGAGDYTFVLARLGLVHLGCNREVAAYSCRFYCIMNIISYKPQAAEVPITYLAIESFFVVSSLPP